MLRIYAFQDFCLREGGGETKKTKREWGRGRCKYVPGVKIYKFPCVEINPGFYDWVGKEGRGGSS